MVEFSYRLRLKNGIIRGRVLIQSDPEEYQSSLITTFFVQTLLEDEIN